MVGFIKESAKEEEGSVADQLKRKAPNEPESYGFDFEGFSTDLDGLSLSSLEPLLDFDSIKDWIEEMQVPNSAEPNKAEIGGECGEGSHLVNPIGNSFVQDMDSLEKSESVKVGCGGIDEHTVENQDGIVDTVKSDGLNGSSMVNLLKAGSGSVEPAQIDHDGHHGEMKTFGGVVDKSGVGVLDDRSCLKFESLCCSIEEGLEKVKLVGDGGGLVINGSGTKDVSSKTVGDDDSDSESKSESESECDSSSSSSSSSSASSTSSGSDDDKEEMGREKQALCKINREKFEQRVDMEEGEIMDSNAVHADKMVSWSDNDEDDEDDNANVSREDSELGDDFIDDEGDGDVLKGPIKSKNEIQVLPPVPPVNVSLQPGHQISPVGIVSSVLGTQVIVEGSEKHNPLSEGSILWFTERRLPLGLVDEIFGPVKTPYYIVRYNSESEVPSGVENGTAIGFVQEFVGHVLNDKNLYQKGYDASGENDEEVFDEAEFSDDEKEAEYRKVLKISKRENKNEGQGPGNKKKNRRNAKSRENTWTRNQPSVSHSPTVRPSQPNQMQQHSRGPSPSFSQINQSGASPSGAVFNAGPSVPPFNQGNQLASSPMGQVFSGGPTAFPQLPQPAAFLLNGCMPNGMPFQQQNMAMPSGCQMNGMPWLQQNPQAPLMPSMAPTLWQQQQHVPQFLLGNPGPSQQPFDLSQLVAGANGSALGPMNFTTGPANSPWPGLMGPNFSSQAPFVAGQQNPNGQLPMFSGFMSAGRPPVAQPQSCNSQPAASFSGNEEVSSQFSQGFSSGRGRGRKPFHHRGGRFGGGRGRQQPN